MIVECPEHIFKKFTDGCGGYVDPSGEVRAFFYGALSDGTWLGDSVTLWCVKIECEHKKDLSIGS
jgi:hypothetical protein